MAGSRAFQKYIILHFFCKHSYYISGFCDKKFYFCKFVNSRSRAQELSNDVSFVIFGHKTWDLEGKGSNWSPPPSRSWFSSTPVEIGLITYVTSVPTLLLNILPHHLLELTFSLICHHYYVYNIQCRVYTNVFIYNSHSLIIVI